MKFAVLDFETTGSGPDDDAIQVGLVLIDNNIISGRYSSLIRTSKEIPPFIEQLTGIHSSMLEDAPEPEDVLVDLIPLLNERVLVGHNIHFDLQFLQKMLQQAGYLPFTGRVLDTLPLLRILFWGLGSLQLSMASATLGIPHDRPHQADSDAEATAHLLMRCIEKINDLPPLTLQRLDDLFNEFSNDLGWFFREYREQAELNYSEQNLGDIDFYRQFAIRAGNWTDEASARSEEDVPFAETTYEQFLSRINHNLELKFEGFETRDAQIQMMEEVFTSLENSKHLIVEAGTGTGKSMGYLIPSLYYGIKNDQKITISTHTINLQEQLRTRDIPLLQDIFPVPFRASVLKGRNHYLCLRKFEQKINYKDYTNDYEDPVTAAQLLVWLGETKHGDDEELYFSSKTRPFWSTVASDTESCLNRSCPWFKKCFYHRSKHEANISDVVITNHSLLFSDAKADHRLLPSSQHLIVDEAHHFEEVANKHFGIDVSYFSALNALTFLFKDSKTGLLPAIHFKLTHHDNEYLRDLGTRIDAMYPQIIQLKEEWDFLTEQLYKLLAGRNDRSPVAQESGYVLRLKAQQLPEEWDALLTLEDQLVVGWNELIRKLEQLISKLREYDSEDETEAIITDLSGGVKQLIRVKDAIQYIMTMKELETVYWIEANSFYKHKSVQLCSVPIQVAPLLKQHFFDVKESVILTSATLSVGSSFQYVCEQLGLLDAEEEQRLSTVQLPAPFNYRKQALVCVPRDFPSLKGGRDDDFVQALIASLQDVATAMNGRLLVLFTSNKMLREVYDPLKDALTIHHIKVLGQGIDSNSRSKLTKLFKDNAQTVLLGTSSFWEGVDIPGDSLSCLAIVRLPFQPPNHPLTEAKSEKLKEQNKNPFMKLSVPQAVIRFKQGFGRLVRTSGDKGAVIIYDTRVLHTSYGKHFLYSLPGPKIEHMVTSKMVSRLKNWLLEPSRGDSDIEFEDAENI